MVPCCYASHHATSPVDEPELGKRDGDSAFGQPRPGLFRPKRAKLKCPPHVSENASETHGPFSVQEGEILSKEVNTEIYPVLTQHFVYPFMNVGDPTLEVKIRDKSVPMLLDTGAHVSVLPKSVAMEIVTLPLESLSNRNVRFLVDKKLFLMVQLI